MAVGGLLIASVASSLAQVTWFGRAGSAAEGATGDGQKDRGVNFLHPYS